MEWVSFVGHAPPTSPQGERQRVHLWTVTEHLKQSPQGLPMSASENQTDRRGRQQRSSAQTAQQNRGSSATKKILRSNRKGWEAERGASRQVHIAHRSRQAPFWQLGSETSRCDRAKTPPTKKTTSPLQRCVGIGTRDSLVQQMNQVNKTQRNNAMPCSSCCSHALVCV